MDIYVYTYIFLCLCIYIYIYTHTHIYMVTLVQFNQSVVSKSLQPHGLQHTRAPRPSQTPRLYSNSCPCVMYHVPVSISCPLMPSNLSSSVIPLFLPPSIFPSIIVFSNELVLHIRWPKYWNFSFNISPSNEYSN